MPGFHATVPDISKLIQSAAPTNKQIDINSNISTDNITKITINDKGLNPTALTDASKNSEVETIDFSSEQKTGTVSNNNISSSKTAGNITDLSKESSAPNLSKPEVDTNSTGINSNSPHSNVQNNQTSTGTSNLSSKGTQSGNSGSVNVNTASNSNSTGIDTATTSQTTDSSTANQTQNVRANSNTSNSSLSNNNGTSSSGVNTTARNTNVNQSSNTSTNNTTNITAPNQTTAASQTGTNNGDIDINNSTPTNVNGTSSQVEVNTNRASDSLTNGDTVNTNVETVSFENNEAAIDEMLGLVKGILKESKGELKDLENIYSETGMSLTELDAYYEELIRSNDSNVSAIIENYRIYCSPEKLKELGLTQEQVSNMDYDKLFKIVKEKDSYVKDMYDSVEQYKKETLDELIKNSTDFKNYAEYEKYVNELKTNISSLETYKYKLDQMKKVAKYNDLATKEDFQNYNPESLNMSYDDIKGLVNYTETGATISYTTYSRENGNVNPVEFVKALQKCAPGTQATGISNLSAIKNLIEASEDNPDLIKMYDYLYEKEGIDSANKYLEAMRDQINSIIGQKQAAEFLNSLSKDENGNFENASFLNQLKVFGKGTGDGVESFFAGIAAWVKADDVYSASEYESLYILQALQTDERFSNILDNNYEISQSIGNMLPTIAISIALTPEAGALAMGVSAGGNSFHGSLVEGKSISSSIIYGIASGTSEALLEKYLGAIPGLGDVKVSSLKTFGKAMLQEGIEEGTQEYVDALLRYGIFDEKIDLATVTKNAEKSALYGAFIGGIMNSPNLAIASADHLVTKESSNTTISREQVTAMASPSIPTSSQTNSITNDISNASDISSSTTNASQEMGNKLSESFEEITLPLIKISSIEDILFNSDRESFNNLLKTGDTSGNINMSTSESMTRISNYILNINNYLKETNVVPTVETQQRISILNNVLSQIDLKNVLDATNITYINEMGKAVTINIDSYSKLLENPVEQNNILEKIKAGDLSSIVEDESVYENARQLLRHLDKSGYNVANSKFSEIASQIEANSQNYENLMRNNMKKWKTELYSKLSGLETKMNSIGEASDPAILQGLIDCLQEKAYSSVQDRIEVMTIIDNINEMKMMEPKFHLKNIDGEASYSGAYWQSSTKALCCTTEQTTQGTITHELGHALFDIVYKTNTTGWESLAAQARVNISNGDALNQYTQYASKVQNDNWNKAITKLLSDYNCQNMEEFKAYVHESYRNYFYSLSPNEILNSLVENGIQIELGEKLKLKISSLLKLDVDYIYREQLIQKVSETYITEEKNKRYSTENDFNHDKKNIALPALSDILYSIFQANKKDNPNGIVYDLNNKVIYNAGSHVTLDDYHYFHEVIANFNSMKYNNCTEQLQLLKSLIGDAPYNFIEDIYLKMNGLKEFTPSTNANTINTNVLNNAVNTGNDVNNQVAASIIQGEPTINTKTFFKKTSISEMFSNLSLEKFKAMSSEEQLEIIKNKNPLSLTDIIPELSGTNKEIFDNNILKNQNSIFIKMTVDEVMGTTKLKEYIKNNENILTKLSDENIVRLLGNVYKNEEATILVNEIEKRIDNGSTMFGQTEIPCSSIIGEIKKLLYAYSNMPKEISDKAYNNIEQTVLANVPEDILQLNFKTLFQQAALAEMIKNNQIDNTGLEILKQLDQENINNLKTFNVKMLDKDIISDFGIEFVKEIGKFPLLSSKLLALKSTNPELYNIYKKINNDSKIDNSLENYQLINLSSIEFLSDNAWAFDGISLENVNTTELLEYILLQSKSVSKLDVDFSNSFRDKIIENCDTKVEKTINDYLNDKELFGDDFLSQHNEKIKDQYFQKYFSMTLQEMQAFYMKYGSHLGEIESQLTDSSGQNLKEIFNYIDNVLNENDIEEMISKYNSQSFRFSVEEMMAIESQIKEKYTATYGEQLLKMKNEVENTKEYTIKEFEGHQIKEVELSKFQLLVHSSDSGFVSEVKGLEGNSYIKQWSSIDKPGTHGLSTSYITEENIGACPVQGKGVMYGFYDIAGSDIYEMGPYDIDSHIANYAFKSGKQQIFIPAENISKNSTRVYNEFVLNRASTKPSCVILFSDASENIVENTYKAAAEWDIPVVKINKQAIASAQMNKINTLVDRFNNTKNLDYLTKAIESYETNISGLKLNTVDGTGQGYVDSIDNSNLLETFDAKKLNESINNYVDEIVAENNYEAKIKLETILNGIQKIYDIANKNGTNAIPQTAPTIDIAGIIERITNMGDGLNE